MATYKPLIALALVSVLAICILTIYAKQQTDDNKLFMNLEAFLNDPLSNFSKIKDIPDFCLLLSRYERESSSVKGELKPSLLYDFLRIHFRETSNNKLAVLIHLLLHCNCTVYAEVLGNEATNIFSLDPKGFLRVLETNVEWEKVLDRISLNWDCFVNAVDKLGDAPFANKVKKYTVLLSADRADKLKCIEAFVEDPVVNFDRISKMDNLCYWIGEYEKRFVKDGVLDNFTLSVLFSIHFKEIDDKKTGIIIHMMEHCGGGVYSELITDEAAKIFRDHPAIFLRALEGARNWESIIDNMVFVGGLDPTDIRTKLGNSALDIKLRNYLAKRFR